MTIWGALQQLAQQPDPEGLAPQLRHVGMLAKSADKPEITPLLSFTTESEPDQPQGLLGQLMKGD